MSQFRKGLMVAVALLLTACASMEQAHQKSIDESLSLTYGANLGDYRRVLLDRLTCAGPPCDPMLVASMANLVSKGMTDACYTLIEPEMYARYARHYARRVRQDNRPGGQIAGEPLLSILEFDPGLLAVLVDELGIDAILSGGYSIGAPDDITGFRTGTLDLTLTQARNGTVGWRSRMQGYIHDPESMPRDIDLLTRDSVQGIVRHGSICSLPAPPPESTDDIQLIDRQIKLRQKIYFKIDSAELDPRSFQILNRLSQYLVQHPEIREVQVAGHTDDVGDSDYNLELSKRRAASVVDFLVAKGVEARRLEATGFGESRPLVPNDSEANRARNRRVEFEVIKTGAPRGAAPPRPRGG